MNQEISFYFLTCVMKRKTRNGKFIQQPLITILTVIIKLKFSVGQLTDGPKINGSFRESH